MSKAVKCDRCKQCFDPMGMMGGMIKFRNPSVYFAKDLRGGAVLTSSPLMENMAVDDMVDLCPQCGEKFVDFMATAPIRNFNTDLNEKGGV